MTIQLNQEWKGQSEKNLQLKYKALKVSLAPFLQFQQLNHLSFESILYLLSLTFKTW